MRVTPPFLTSSDYNRGAHEDAPVALSNYAEYSHLALDFYNGYEAAVVASGGPWTSASIGVVAGNTFSLNTSGSNDAIADPGTSASTGFEYYMSAGGLALPGTTRTNFVLAARVAKAGNADVFGAFGLNGAAGLTSPLTTAGAINTSNSGFYFRLDGSGNAIASAVNASTATVVSDGVARGLNTFVDLSIVGSNYSSSGNWGNNNGTGTIKFYVGSKLLMTLSAKGSTSFTTIGLRPSFATVNGTATTGQHRIDYIYFTHKRV